ncbi:hypothetical protein UUU_42290 [Klebsiella pneumoniae subsp. pneumoniae DSM 30104 = JCM 1662 = NBRC 14940]|nr:hypothetical protein UUU_42290 [Klebsiella pneumoniae subsp. pneumoniae DSM 30104 = JCM 1662 = NBRC 14940]
MISCLLTATFRALIIHSQMNFLLQRHISFDPVPALSP